MDIKSSGFSVHEEYDLLSHIHADPTKGSAFGDHQEYGILDGIVPLSGTVTVITEAPSSVTEPGVHHERRKIFRKTLH